MSIPEIIGRNIVNLRRRRGITQEWLALEADMAVSYLRSIEHGKANPTIEALERLAKILDVPLHLLLLEDDLPQNELTSYRDPSPVTMILRVSSGLFFPVCPHCQCTLEREYQMFCDRCGQRLEWKNFDSAQIINNR